MILGDVSEDDVPIIIVTIADEQWPAVIDTGFNGDLELPIVLKGRTSPRRLGEVTSFLAGGQIIREDSYLVEVPFDGEIISAVATFVQGSQILIGTRLLREYQLRIGFVSRTVELERE